MDEQEQALQELVHLVQVPRHGSLAPEHLVRLRLPDPADL
jgi:hypothetical protein